MQSNLVGGNGPPNVPSQMNDIHSIRAAAAAGATSNIVRLLLVDFDGDVAPASASAQRKRADTMPKACETLHGPVGGRGAATGAAAIGHSAAAASCASRVASSSMIAPRGAPAPGA